jgi:hypothetical protein
MHVPTPLQSRIAELQKINSMIREFQSRITDIPAPYRVDVAAELRAIADSLSPEDTPVPNLSEAYGDESSDDEPSDDEAGTVGGRSVADRIKVFFNLRGNRPASMPEICAGAQVNEETCKSLLYKRNRGRFVQAARPNGAGHPGLWKLAEPETASKFDDL